MGITKTEGFNIQVTKMAEMLKALGHPARLGIILHLANTPGCICNDLIDVIPLAQPTISRHLSELKKVGLIQGNIEGKNICYCINESVWNEIKQVLSNVSTALEKRNTCC